MRIKIGYKKNSLTAVEYVGENAYGTPVWKWLCSCGESKISPATPVITGNIRSCGCESRPMVKRGWHRSFAEKEACIRRIISNYIYSCRGGSKRRGIEWKLTYDDVSSIIRLPCHYCGLVSSNSKTIKGQQKGLFVLRYNGIDRVDSSLGYTKDNVVPCCKHCNFAKNDRSVDEFLAHAQTICDFQLSKKQNQLKEPDAQGSATF